MSYKIEYYNVEGFTLEEGLSDCVLGKKRESKSKPFIILEDKYMYKGPYVTSAFKKVLGVLEMLSLWKTPLIMFPKFGMEAPKVKGGSLGKYFVYTNLLDKRKITTKQVEEDNTDYKYKVAKSNTLMTLKEAIDKKKYEISDEVGIQITIALCHLYILGVDCLKLSKIMIDFGSEGESYKEPRLFIEDYDELLDEDDTTNDAVFYFTNINKKYKWADRFSGNYRVIAHKIKKSVKKHSEKYSDRYNTCISLLKEYYRPPDAVKIEELKGNINVKKFHELKKKDVKSKVILRTYNGPFDTYGMSGHGLDVLKSGLQKEIRRGNYKEALKYAFDIYNFKGINVAPVTNLFNRLEVIAIEDIGMGNMNLVINVLYMLMDPDKITPENLAVIVELLCESNKTRNICQHWRAYCTPEGISLCTMLNKKIKQVNESADGDIDIPEEDENYLTMDPISIDKPSKVYLREIKYMKRLPNDDTTLCSYLDMFETRLKDKDVRCFYWLYTYYNDYMTSESVMSTRYKNPYSRTIKGMINLSNNPFCIIWEILAKYGNEKILSPLCILFYDCYDRNATVRKKCGFLRDEKYYLGAAIMSIVYKVQYKDLKLSELKPHSNIKELTDPEKVINIKVQPYVLDKHTGIGARNGKNIIDFVNDGCVIIPEDREYSNESLTWVYNTRLDYM